MKIFLKIFGVLGLFLSLFINNPATHVEMDSQAIENLKHCGATGGEPYNDDPQPKGKDKNKPNSKSVKLG